MSEPSEEIYNHKQPLPIPESARAIHKQIVEKLTWIERMEPLSCLEPLFLKNYSEVLDLFEKYRTQVLLHSKKTPSCSCGCAQCCRHWVEDVNSFEAEIIAGYIRKNFPERIPIIIERCKKDEEELKRLERIVFSKAAREIETGRIDEVDLLLSVFYQARRPCPLLEPDDSCSIYPVRPLTCRIYMSFSDPSHCDPDYINSEDIPTYLLDLEESACDILDRLHFRYLRFSDDTGLRSLVPKYLLDFNK